MTNAVRSLVAALLFITLTLTLSAVAVALPSPAQATNFGSTACQGTPRNCVSLANNIWHAVRYYDLGFQPSYEDPDNHIPGIDTAVTWSLANNYDPSDLVAYRDESDPLPDVRVYDANYGPNGLAGWVECPADHTGQGGSDPNRWCRGQKLRFNSYYYHFDSCCFDTLIKRRSMACHELGHTIGLRHRAGSCMSNSEWLAGISAHDRDHIDSNY